MDTGAQLERLRCEVERLRAKVARLEAAEGEWYRALKKPFRREALAEAIEAAVSRDRIGYASS